MKKHSICFCICLSIILSISTFDCSANNSDTIKVYTTDSVLSNFSGTYTGNIGSVDISTEASYLYRVSSEWTGFSILEDHYDNIPFSDTCFLYMTSSQDNVGSFLFVDIHATDDVIVVFGAGAKSTCYCASVSAFSYDLYTIDSNTGDWVITRSGSSSVPTNYAFQGLYVTDFNTQLYSLLDYSNLSFYCNSEWDTWSNYDDYIGMSSSILLHDNEHNFTNFVSEDFDYFNGSEIVSPSVEESNENHMYFNSCQLGFCEPYGVSNFSNFGGAYFYAKYSVDEWVRNHITDYSLYFYATAYVDSRQYSGSTEVRLDNDGCITIPFSDIFSTDGGVVSDGFLAYISPNLVEQSFYDTSLYSVNKEQVQAFVDQRNLSTQDDWDRFWQDLYTLNSGEPVGNPGIGGISYLSNNFSALLNGTISPSIINLINNHTNFKIHVNCYLKDNSGNVSGTVGKMFDLKVGNNISTNNEGLTNTNPYIETDLPSDYVPSLITDNNGYSLSNIGNSNQIVNFQFPSDIELFIDNGFKQFLSWFETSADTAYASNRFWSSMGIFEGNPATELYSEYFGFLPDDFKTLIFSCAGIGIVGGAYCILRRRLH